MTDKLRDPIEMMEAETRLILAEFFRRGVSKEKWEDAPHLAARKVRAALAAAPQPAQADREALANLITDAELSWQSRGPHTAPSKSLAIADALLARGLRLPGGGETMACKHCGEKQRLEYLECTECGKCGAIRVVEGGDDAA